MFLKLIIVAKVYKKMALRVQITHICTEDCLLHYFVYISNKRLVYSFRLFIK